jgi:hypothetical protein
MNSLKHALAALCDELGLVPPAPDERGRYEVSVDDLVLRLGPWERDQVVLEGVISRFGADPSRAWGSQQDVLRQVLTWNIARLKGQARPEVLSFDDEENVLLLWRTWPADERLTREVLQGAEDMLNELEFWKGKLATVEPALGGRGGRG